MTIKEDKVKCCIIFQDKRWEYVDRRKHKTGKNYGHSCRSACQLVSGLWPDHLVTQRGLFSPEHPDLPASVYWVLGAITSLLFFGSVLVHEWAHAMLALRNGIAVRGINLFIFGGVAQIEREPETPGAEFRIAVAGPLTSLVLGIGFAVLWLFDRGVPYLAAPSAWLMRTNLPRLIGWAGTDVRVKGHIR